MKAQQTRWSQRGAHRLLHIRTQVLNKELHTRVQQWYPGMADKPEAKLPLAAQPPFLPALLDKLHAQFPAHHEGRSLHRFQRHPCFVWIEKPVELRTAGFHARRH